MRFLTLSAAFEVVDNHIESIIHTLASCIQSCLDANTFVDKSAHRDDLNADNMIKIVSGVQIFKPVALLMIG